MKTLILTTACAATVITLAACKGREENEMNAANVEEMNYAENVTDMNDMNMSNDMNMTDGMDNMTDNAADNATGNAAVGNSSGY